MAAPRCWCLLPAGRDGQEHQWVFVRVKGQTREGRVVGMMSCVAVLILVADGELAGIANPYTRASMGYLGVAPVAPPGNPYRLIW